MIFMQIYILIFFIRGTQVSINHVCHSFKSHSNGSTYVNNAHHRVKHRDLHISSSIYRAHKPNAHVMFSYKLLISNVTKHLRCAWETGDSRSLCCDKCNHASTSVIRRFSLSSSKSFLISTSIIIISNPCYKYAHYFSAVLNVWWHRRHGYCSCH